MRARWCDVDATLMLRWSYCDATLRSRWGYCWYVDVTLIMPRCYVDVMLIICWCYVLIRWCYIDDGVGFGFGYRGVLPGSCLWYTSILFNIMSEIDDGLQVKNMLRCRWLWYIVFCSTSCKKLVMDFKLYILYAAYGYNI